MIDENNEKRFVENFEGVEWNGIGAKSIEEASQTFKEELKIEATKKYSPIGSVVRIQNNNKKYMIIGFNCNYNSEVKDYLACEYPTGIADGIPLIGFNHEDILAFYSIGYFDMLGRSYQTKLNEQNRGYKC